MANNVVSTQIILCNDTSVNWGSSTKVLLKGETAIEFISNGDVKIKIGNGVDTFADLPYATMTPAEINTAITNAINAANHTHSNKAILDQIQVALTTALKTNYDKAYTHSTQAHAPSNAQANVIEGVSVNGTKLTPTNKVVDVKIPAYNLDAPASVANGSAKIILTNGTTTDSVNIKGTGATSVTTDTSGNIVINSNDTKYTHPNSGVTAGTYKSVTVNAQGHVTGGTNPTTLAGYGITDAYTKTQVNSEIATAIANVDHLKREIVSSLPEVASADANTIYMIAKADGSGNQKYDEYMLINGAFEKIGDSSVDLTDYAKKTEVATAKSEAIAAAASDATTKANQAESNAKSYSDGLAKNYATAAQGKKADTAVQSVKIGETEYKQGTNVVLPAYPTTLPASDVYAWAKQPNKPTYNKSEVGLGNLTNDRQVKGLSTGTTADHVVTWGTDGYTVKDSGFTIASNVPPNAKFTDTTYSDMKGATSTTAGTHGLVPAPAAGKQGQYLRGDGTWATPTNTDTKVTNTLNTTAKAYITGTTSATTNTGEQVFDTGVYLDTTAGMLTATTFKGKLTGNADSSTTSAKLTTPRNFSLTGNATAATVSFNGTSNVALNVTSLNAMGLTVESGDTLILNGGGAS